MATLFERAKRLTFWLMGTPDDTPPPVPIPPKITPLRDHVAFFLNLRGRLPPEMTREQIMDKCNNAVTDQQLQAHIMAYMRDYHGIRFSRELNPNAPIPQYYSSASQFYTKTTPSYTTSLADNYGGVGYPPKPSDEPLLVAGPFYSGEPVAASATPYVRGDTAALFAHAVPHKVQVTSPVLVPSPPQETSVKTSKAAVASSEPPATLAKLEGTPTVDSKQTASGTAETPAVQEASKGAAKEVKQR